MSAAKTTTEVKPPEGKFNRTGVRVPNQDGIGHGLGRQAKSHQNIQCEQLLTHTICAEQLGLSYQQLRLALPHLIAAGLCRIEIPSSVPGGRPMKRYTASSLDRLIRRAERTERPLF